MGKFTLDEIEADEIYHALCERKSTLEKRVKDLSEKDGLPEAAEAVRERLALYSPNGDGRDARPGLIRTFAPQRDVEAEARNSRASEERDPNGQQDVFGGGAETGGAPRAKRGSGRKKDKANAEGTEAAEGGESAGGTSPVELTTEQRDALERLAAIGEGLRDGAPYIVPEEFTAEASRVLELMAACGPAFVADAIDRARAQFDGEFKDSEENARNLGAFVVGLTAPHITPAGSELPIGSSDAHTEPEAPAGDAPAADPSVLSFAPPVAAGELVAGETDAGTIAGNTHGSPELDADAAKLEGMGANAGPTLAELEPPPVATDAAP